MVMVIRHCTGRVYEGKRDPGPQAAVVSWVVVEKLQDKFQGCPEVELHTEGWETSPKAEAGQALNRRKGWITMTARLNRKQQCAEIEDTLRYLLSGKYGFPHKLRVSQNTDSFSFLNYVAQHWKYSS